MKGNPKSTGTPATTTATSRQPALALRDVRKSFGNTRVLRGISLDVEPSAFCILLGPSGCGKSTALRCVAGLEEPEAGEIELGGISVRGKEPGKRDLAMVFQSYALYPHMSVYRNLEFPLKMSGAGGNRAARRERIQKAATLLQLQDLLSRKPRQLSGGQRQRVAIGRALMREPKLFLFDEPLSNLDARLRGEMRVELARLHRSLGTTMLYVTHDQVEAMTLGTQLVVMNEGRIEQTGTPREIYTTPATRFVASFLGTPPMNLIPGHVEAGVFVAHGVRVPLGDEVLAALPATPGSAPTLEVGVRPEHIQPGRPRGEKEGVLEGQVELVEDLGAERVAYITLGERTRVIARLEADEAASTAYRIAPSQVHVFLDGKRVVPQNEPAPTPVLRPG